MIAAPTAPPTASTSSLGIHAGFFGYGARATCSLVRTTCGDDDTTMCLFGLPHLQTELPRVRAVAVDNTRWWLRQAPFVGLRLDAFKHLDRQTARAITRMVQRQRAGTIVIAERWVQSFRIARF